MQIDLEKCNHASMKKKFICNILIAFYPVKTELMFVNIPYEFLFEESYLYYFLKLNWELFYLNIHSIYDIDSFS